MTDERLVLEEKDAGPTLSAVLRRWKDVPWSTAKDWCARGKVTVDGGVVLDPGSRPRAGAEIVLAINSPSRGAPDALFLDRARLVHCDAHVVVVDKPPGVNSVPFEEGERGSLVDRVAAMLPRWKLGPPRAPLFVVHRLDRETSGLLVFGRSWVAKRHLASLFRSHDVERLYVAVVQGRLTQPRTFESFLVEDRGDGLRGSARTKLGQAQGQRAVTHVRPLLGLKGATLVECRLETGRQHQIRIHLSESGFPVLGDRVYARGRDDMPPAPRVMLHARTLGFKQPAREDDVVQRFEAAVPADIVAVLRGLGFTGDEVPK